MLANELLWGVGGLAVGMIFGVLMLGALAANKGGQLQSYRILLARWNIWYTSTTDGGAAGLRGEGQPAAFRFRPPIDETRAALKGEDL